MSKKEENCTECQKLRRIITEMRIAGENMASSLDKSDQADRYVCIRDWDRVIGKLGGGDE